MVAGGLRKKEGDRNMLPPGIWKLLAGTSAIRKVSRSVASRIACDKDRFRGQRCC